MEQIDLTAAVEESWRWLACCPACPCNAGTTDQERADTAKEAAEAMLEDVLPHITRALVDSVIEEQRSGVGA